MTMKHLRYLLLLPVILLLTGASPHLLVIARKNVVEEGGGGPVVYDATSGSFAVSGTTISWSHTCTGDDRGLFVGVGWETFSSEIVSGVTYNGVSMTEIWVTACDTVPNISTGYFLVNPASGSNTVTVTFTGTITQVAMAAAVSFTNVNQSTPTGTVATANSGASSTNPSTVTVGDAATGDIVVDTMAGYTTAITVGANQTARAERDNQSSNNQSFGVSTQDGADGGVMSWTHSNAYWATGAVAVKPN